MTEGKASGSGGQTQQAALRPLTVDDLEPVVAIDRQLSGRSRRGFYEARLKAALREPDRFVYIGICETDERAGFVFVHLLEGEFGAAAAVGVLDAIGVDPARAGHGLGRTLMRGLDDILRHKNVGELQSQLDWNNHALMGFLNGAGFHLAPRLVLSRTVAAPVNF